MPSIYSNDDTITNIIGVTTKGQAAASGSLPVVLASDQTLPLPVGAATDATAATLLQEGADITGASMPAGGTHGRGWLSAIWKALTDRLPTALTGSGNLKVAVVESTVTQTVAGTVTSNQGGSNWTENVVQLNGTTIDTNSGTKSAGTQRIVLATDQPALTNALKVDGSAVTQPVSGTVTANAGTGTFTTQQSNITADYDTGAGTQTTTMFGVALPASGGAVAGGTSTNPIRTDPTGTTTQPVSGTVTSNQGGSNWSVNAAQVGGTATDTNSGNKSAGTLRVVLATDQPALTNTLKVDPSGVTSPVSGTVTATQGTAAAGSGAWPMTVTNTSDTVVKPGDSGNNAIRVNVVAGGASGGTSSSFGSADPSTGTAVGYSDGTNMREARVFDADSGAGTQYVLGALLKKPASGGSVDFGTSSDPVRTDPTGTTTQPVSQATAANLNATVVGTGSDNSANPTTKLPTLPARANTSAPSWSDGNMVPLSVDTAGALRVSGAAGGGVADTQVRNASNTWTDVGYSSGNLNLPVQGAVPAATTMQNAATANGNGTSLNVAGYVSAVLSVTASVAMSGGTTINFEASTDDTTWVALLVNTVGANTYGTTTTTTGDYCAPQVAGYKSVRARISAYSAGTITVKGYPATVPGAAPVVNANIVANTATNASTNVAQVAGTAVDTNSGSKSGGTLRVVVATDQPQLTNALKVDGSAVTQPVSGTITANAGSGTFAIQATAGSPAAVELSDGAAFYTGTKTGQLPSALVGGRVDANTGAWLGSTAPTVGQKAMANSVPVVLASDQAAVPVNNTMQAAAAPSATTMQNAATANGNGTSLNVAGYATAVLNVTASVAMSGGTTINFEASVDDTTWVAIAATTVGANTITLTTTTTGDFVITCAGYKSLRARISAYSAGTITVKGYPIAIAAAPPVVNANIVSSTLSNQSVNVAQIAGTTTDTNSGTKSAGTQRVVLATDQPALTNALKVDPSAVTSPISAASLPLPSGAATSAKQPALGTAGSASADVLSVQGVASMTALKVDGSGVTQPVSGTFWQSTQPVSVAAGATNIAKAEDVASADADVGVPAMAIRKATPGNTSGTDGDYEMLQISAGRLWASATIDAALPTGANTIGALSANQSVNVAQLAGTTTDTNSGTKSAGTLRVVLATDQPALTNKLLVTPDANSAVNVAQIAGASTATAASGVQKVGIVGNAGATVDSPVGAGTAPTNAVIAGALYNSSAPAPTNGQAMALQADQAGNQRVFGGIALATLSAWNSGTGLNATQTIYSNSGADSVLVHLVQTTTLTAGAVTFELSYDNSNWVTIPAMCVLDPSSTSFAQIAVPYTVQASTNKAFLIELNGAQALRIKLSTQITGTGAVTPNYALLNYSPAQTTIALSPTAANFNVTLGTGANTIGALSANQSVNVAQINGVTPLMGNGTSGTGAQRVTIASDSTGQVALATGSNTIGNVGPIAVATGGYSKIKYAAQTTTVQTVKGSAGKLGGYYVYNPNASVAYVQIFDVSGTVTLGTTAPDMVLGIPATGAANLDSAIGIDFANAIKLACTTTATGSTAPGTGLDLSVWYK